MIAETPKIPDSEQRLNFHLGNWARWMRAGEHVQGYKHQAAGCVGGGYFGDFDDMVLAADRRSAAIMDSLIQDLTPAQTCAVHHAWINAVYRFRDYDRTYEQATELLLLGMDRKGLW